ncbi:MAG: HEAT repeat domain-containing protein, partial [Candidatus Hydrogenedentes bacterium]|nr:HEAT repeat domain-containing protein [Candidatus Hydrogenedentota bacterium]
MKRYMFCSVALACCLLPVWAGAQDQPQPEKKVRADGPQQDEAQLIAVLQGSAAWAEKELACRALRRVGTAQSVPALAALLGDEKLSHHARYALEVMPFPEAGQALRAAVATTSGLQKVGVVTTLGARHDAEAAPVIGPLLQDSNPDIARAAAGALGRIATPEAVNALTGAYAGAPEATKMAVAEGLLAAGDRLSGEGKDKQAAAIYEGLLAPEAPESVRLGAFRGLAHTQPRQSMERVLEAMKGDDAKLRNFAAQLVAETTEGTRRYAGALGKLPPAGQVALLRGLANRKDTAAHHAVVKTLDSSETDVKLAAIHALGALGGSVDVATLTALLGAEDQAVAGAARAALAAMKTPEVNSAVFAAVSGAAPAVRVQLIGLLTDRMTPEAVAAGLQNIGDADLNVRIASLEALAQLGTAKEVEVVLASLKQTQDAKERSTATRALGSISAHHGEEVLPLLLASMQDANLEARLAMLRTLVQIRNPKALEAVVAALSDPEKQISDEAARVLSNWPTADAA